MTMSMGMNTNIEFQGKVYHAQTEDGGLDHPIITTLLFKDGVVFASKRTDYKDLLESPSCRETVAEMMKEQHKNMIRELVAGKITGTNKTLEAAPDPAAAKDAREAGTPGAEGQAKAAPKPGEDAVRLDALIVEYLKNNKKDTD